MSDVINNFLEYIKIDTQSDPESASTPTTKKQLNLAKLLVKQLEKLGLDSISLDENGYVMASLPSNVDKKVPIVGFLAHMDTAPDASGANVNAQFIENYDGSDIVLNQETNMLLSPTDFPELSNYIGQTIITTDGTTLLGGDDKAGIAEIMAAMKHLVENPAIKHGTITVGFTPDEEVGQGADFFDVEKFGADFAYTLDGGEIGELEYENFNAAGAKIKINGRNVHPGTAKNQMINSQMLAMELHSMLPADQRPEHTEGYEGFFLLISIHGAVETTDMQYIVRDHDMAKFLEKKKLLENVIEFMNKKYGEGTVALEMKDQYYNMREKVEPVKYIVDMAEAAMIEIGISPKIKAIRGGTDGSRLSYMGLPTPNIFAGGHNFHGKHEYIVKESMEKAVEVILKITEKFAK